MMWQARLVRFSHILSLWLFWPGMALVTWGELTPHPPELGGMLFWDKAQHLTAYFGLGSMATLALGLRPKLAWAISGIVLFGGVLEILQGITGRDPDIFDFLANTIGVFAGLTTATLFLWLLGSLVAIPGTD
jgi:VanZ family protein